MQVKTMNDRTITKNYNYIGLPIKGYNTSQLKRSGKIIVSMSSSSDRSVYFFILGRKRYCYEYRVASSKLSVFDSSRNLHFLYISTVCRCILLRRIANITDDNEIKVAVRKIILYDSGDGNEVEILPDEFVIT